MAVRGWGGSVATAIGVAAGAGAAQLGLGYGLGIIAWLPTAGGASEAAWVASLAWATWIAATSVVAGAITADRLSGTVTASSTPDASAPDTTPVTTALWRLALAVAAAVGALVTVALVAVPARAAVRADTFSPQTIAAGYAVIGVIVGLLVAVAALASRAVATNVIATVGFLWVLAILAVIDGVASGRGLATAQLAVWQFTDTTPGYWFRNLYLPGLALSLGAAFVIGALAAWPAARREGGRVGVAISGAVGPLLVAAAYFLAAPRPNSVPGEQLSAYLLAPYTVIAGLAGSVLTAALVTRAEAARRAAYARTQEVRLPDLPMPEQAAEPYADADATTTTLPATDDPVRTDLADDGYAPARAYVSETASEPETSAVRGQATVKAPLWPEEATGGDKGRGGLFGRGKGKPQT
jgi:hypothetical protein